MQSLAKNPYKILLLAAFGLGAYFRLYALTHGISFHPDERAIVMATDRMSLKDMNPNFFAYGSFPFYTLWIVANLLGLAWPNLANYDGLFIVGRVISVVFGLTGAYLTYRLALKIFNDKILASLSAIFLLFNVFHIQLSRFYAFDCVLTTLCIATLLGATNISDKNSSWKSFLATGIVLGLSVATKISALSLFIPIGLAILIRCYTRKEFFSRKNIFYAVLLVFIALFTFTLAEPYAWLDWTEFIRQTREQISMVKGEWRPPYTVQYVDTTPYIYPLEQMLKFTIGWPIGILALAGIFLAVARQFRKISYKEVVVLGWALVTFLVIARYQVKFPRYLLPIYPILMIFAASALLELVNAIQRIFPNFYRPWLVGAFITISFLQGLCFVSIYASEHSYHLATHWIFKNIPDNSRLLEGHWDDTLPLHLPGLDPARFAREGPESELPLYEPDTPEKLSMVAQRTANADYIIFPTQRLVGSIPRIFGERPEATAYLRLLFSGNLGFELVHSVKVRPKIGSFVVNDDLADESLSVYDHPKVTIFKNVSHLSVSEITSRILDPTRFSPLPSREKMMLMDARSSVYQPIENSNFRRVEQTEDGNILRTSNEEAPNGNVHSLWGLAVWIILIEFLSFLALPVVAVACRKFPDHGFALSKTAGIFIFSYIAWLLPSLGIAQFTQSFLFVVVALMALASLFLYFCIFERNISILPPKKYLITGEIIFLSVLALFLLVRFFNPEIFWGEKPMDFTFLNFFTRTTTLPPQDPWAIGTTMRYYYLGTYFLAALLKLGSISTAVGYNLAIATLPALCVACFYSLLLCLTKKNILAIFGSLSAVLISNIEILRLIFVQREKLGFDSFWASTRFFASGNFTEYPVWSFLFADLHAHVISLPFVALLLTLAIELVRPKSLTRDFSYWIHRVLYGVTLGSLTGLNTWDFIVYVALTGVMLLARPIAFKDAPVARRLVRRGLNVLADLATIGLIAWLAAAPYMFVTQPSQGASWGWAHYFEYNSLTPILLHFGLWIGLILLGFAFLIFRRNKAAESISVSSIIFSIVVSIFPIILGIVCHYHLKGLELDNVGPPPWPVLILCSGLIEVSILGIAIAGSLSLAVRFGFACAGLAACIIPFAEVFFLIDKMNTIFKFYLCLWFLFAAAGTSLSLYIFSSFAKDLKSKSASIFGRTIQIATLFCITFCWIGTLLNFGVTVFFHRTEGPRPGLDGLAYLSVASPEEAKLVSWINNHIQGTPTMLEAQGDSYREFTRMAMYTGLPVVLGWEHHVKQRGTPAEEVDRRRSDIATIYSTSDAVLADQLMNKYDVDLIVIGDVERKTYSEIGINKFLNRKDLFPVLFHTGRTYLLARSTSLTSNDVKSRFTISWTGAE